MHFPFLVITLPTDVSGRGSFGIPKNFSSQRKQSRQLRLIEFSKLMNSAIGEKNSRLEETKFEGLQLVSSNKQNISKIKANLNTDVLYGDLSKCIQVSCKLPKPDYTALSVVGESLLRLACTQSSS